jgi:hypothetical protein
VDAVNRNGGASHHITSAYHLQSIRPCTGVDTKCESGDNTLWLRSVRWVTPFTASETRLNRQQFKAYILVTFWSEFMSYSPRNRSAEIIVAIIGAAAVIAAAIIQLGKPLVERRITGAQSPLAMALKNYNCEPADYYVDGERVCSGLPAGGTAAFKTTTGEHWIYHCLAGTNDCSAASQVTWSVPGPLVIEADAKCTVAVRVENNDCTPTEYYVDDALMIPAVGAGQTGSFQVLRGVHRL